MKRRSQVIVFITPSVIGLDVLERITRLNTVADVSIVLGAMPPLPSQVDTLHDLDFQRVIKWHDDMEFCAREEKSIQPTNPYFGKERWKRKRK